MHAIQTHVKHPVCDEIRVDFMFFDSLAQATLYLLFNSISAYYDVKKYDKHNFIALKCDYNFQKFYTDENSSNKRQK